MRIALTGSSGLIGGALRRALEAEGHTFTRVVRSPAAARAPDAVAWDPRAGRIDAAGLEAHDAVVHLAGESLFGYWTESKKRRIARSRIDGTALLARALAGLARRPATLVCASGVGYYGTRAEPVDESDPAGTGFLAELGQAWEAAAEPARAAGIRVVRCRFAVVLSPDGGALRVMLPIFRLGLGGVIGGGEQPFPWVAIQDGVGAIRHALLEAALEGPVNVVSPQAASLREFVGTLASVLRRPAPIRVPAAPARWIAGEMAEEMLLGGAVVRPRRLLETGYAFAFPELRSALEAVLRR